MLDLDFIGVLETLLSCVNSNRNNHLRCSGSKCVFEFVSIIFSSLVSDPLSVKLY
ncbi:hypothetical protein EXN66_Car017395 [Channa argus]|uniref:Uncharacterized protein n=1 Tax=Channa argus TaxID=215402 RepID=A0A6G1QGW2_CHAAH|nr:hypothetical protein EXN66_Car017395 [Channa argus]